MECRCLPNWCAAYNLQTHRHIPHFRMNIPTHCKMHGSLGRGRGTDFSHRSTCSSEQPQGRVWSAINPAAAAEDAQRAGWNPSYGMNPRNWTINNENEITDDHWRKGMWWTWAIDSWCATVIASTPILRHAGLTGCHNELEPWPEISVKENSAKRRLIYVTCTTTLHFLSRRSRRREVEISRGLLSLLLYEHKCHTISRFVQFDKLSAAHCTCSYIGAVTCWSLGESNSLDQNGPTCRA